MTRERSAGAPRRRRFAFTRPFALIGARALTLPVALAACASESQPERKTERAEGDLSVEIRGVAHVRFEPRGDADLDVALTLDRGFDLAPAGVALTAPGRVERFPEADLRLYAARFSIANGASGVPSPAICGGQSVTLALALTRRLDNDRVSGALTAYCEGSAVPLRILRLAGPLPLR
jgi:hypothetical protein